MDEPCKLGVGIIHLTTTVDEYSVHSSFDDPRSRAEAHRVVLHGVIAGQHSHDDRRCGDVQLAANRLPRNRVGMEPLKVKAVGDYVRSLGWEADRRVLRNCQSGVEDDPFRVAPEPGAQAKERLSAEAFAVEVIDRPSNVPKHRDLQSREAGAYCGSEVPLQKPTVNKVWAQSPQPAGKPERGSEEVSAVHSQRFNKNAGLAHSRLDAPTTAQWKDDVLEQRRTRSVREPSQHGLRTPCGERVDDVDHASPLTRVASQAAVGWRPGTRDLT